MSWSGFTSQSPFADFLNRQTESLFKSSMVQEVDQDGHIVRNSVLCVKVQHAEEAEFEDITNLEKDESDSGGLTRLQ